MNSFTCPLYIEVAHLQDTFQHQQAHEFILTEEMYQSSGFFIPTSKYF